MKAVVIGGGIGGYSCAIRLAQLGADVTLIEKGELGGTCLNRGCIPTKSILHTARMYAGTKELQECGISISDVTVDYGRAVDRKDSIVMKLRGGVAYLMKKNRIRVIEGTAEFISDHAVLAHTGDAEEEIGADSFVIATGSVPADIPAAPHDGETILDSTDVLALRELPGSLAVLGGGVVGCEIAQAFAMLGVKVTVVELLPRLLANMDADLSDVIDRRLKKDGADIRTGTKMISAKAADGVVGIVVEKDGSQETITAEKLLVAVGRRPYTDGLRLENTSVSVGEKGGIIVDECMRTTAENIFAVGDVTGGRLQLAHAASHQGLIAAENIMGGESEWDDSFVPSCVYTWPELSSIGETEESAGVPVSVGRFPLSANGRAMIENCPDGFAKIVTNADDDTIIGVQLAGPFATEMISGMAGIVAFEANTEDVESWIFAHPSVSEAIGEAVMDAHGKALHK